MKKENVTHVKLRDVGFGDLSKIKRGGEMKEERKHYEFDDS